ncbi:DUF2505 domain-containing protein [Propionicicella superfundia]|uniref:DUF2505 domain-containing protein n=1 Tax=Propionicicella superfundia TaxID=348582 RepID=UPI0004169593|nr:DUF2505 domain-containing protein [Propionicicella superfundia]
MDVVSNVDFPAQPARAFAMITDPVFHDQVAERTHARHHEFTLADGLSRVVRVLEAPSSIAKLVGPTLTIVELVEWGDPAADGSREGTFTVSVDGKPVTWRGATTLAPQGDGSVLTYAGELTVAIPFLGKALEKQAAEALEAMVEVQRDVAVTYLAGAQ